MIILALTAHVSTHRSHILSHTTYGIHTTTTHKHAACHPTPLSRTLHLHQNSPLMLVLIFLLHPFTYRPPAAQSHTYTPNRPCTHCRQQYVAYCDRLGRVPFSPDFFGRWLQTLTKAASLKVEKKTVRKLGVNGGDSKFLTYVYKGMPGPFLIITWTLLNWMLTFLFAALPICIICAYLLYICIIYAYANICMHMHIYVYIYVCISFLWYFQ